MNSSLNLKQKLVIMATDVLLIVELVWSIYLGQKSHADLTIIFLKTYIPALIITLVLARILFKKFAPQKIQH